MPQASILTAIPFLINDFPDDSIYHIAIYANDTTLLGKLNVVSFDHSNKTIAIDMKCLSLLSRNGNVLRCQDSLSVPTWISSLTLALFLQLPLVKLKPLFILWSFFPLILSLKSLYFLMIFINVPSKLRSNTLSSLGCASNN